MRLLTVTVMLAMGLTVLGQPPRGKLLWTNKDLGAGMVLTASPDGKELFTVHRLLGTDTGDKPVIARWELATGKLLHRYELEGVGKRTYTGSQMVKYLIEASATPDAKTLLVSWEMSRSRGMNSRHRLKLFDLRTGERRGEPVDDLSSHPGGLMSALGYSNLSPDGRWFFGHKGGALEQLDIHECATGKAVLSLKIEKDVQPMCVGFTEDGAIAAVYLHHMRGGQNPVRLYSLPDGKLMKEFVLPAGTRWQAVHSGRGGRLLVESMEEDAAAKKAAEDEAKAAAVAAPAARRVLANKRVYRSFDPAAADPATTLRLEPRVEGFSGAGMNLPSICCDTGPGWVAYFTEANWPNEVRQAAFQEHGLRWWKDVKVTDRKNGKVLAEFGKVPHSCLVTPDGKYLVACDPVPETNAGVMVWAVPGR